MQNWFVALVELSLLLSEILRIFRVSQIFVAIFLSYFVF